MIVGCRVRHPSVRTFTFWDSPRSPIFHNNHHHKRSEIMAFILLLLSIFCGGLAARVGAFSSHRCRVMLPTPANAYHRCREISVRTNSFHLSDDSKHSGLEERLAMLENEAVESPKVLETESRKLYKKLDDMSRTIEKMQAQLHREAVREAAKEILQGLQDVNDWRNLERELPDENLRGSLEEMRAVKNSYFPHFIRLKDQAEGGGTVATFKARIFVESLAR